MPKFIIDTQNAILFESLAVYKKERGFSFSKFIHTIELCTPHNTRFKHHATSASELHVEHHKILKDYMMCALILNYLLESKVFQEVKPNLSVMLNINNPKVEVFLKRNLIENRKRVLEGLIRDKVIKNGTEILSEGCCIQYVDAFINCHQDHLEEKTIPGWLELAVEGRTQDFLATYQLVVNLLEKEMGKSQEKIWADLLKDPLNFAKYANSPRHRVHVKESFLERKIAANHGFQIEIDWKPNQPVENLIKCLRIRGYLLVGGFLGSEYHTKPPLIKKVGELEVLSWEKGTFFEEKAHSLANMVVIVGASKNGYANTSQDLVYFMNLSEDVENTYPIYMVSYKAFTERLNSINGLYVSRTSFDLNAYIDTQKLCYLFYHPSYAPQAVQHTEAVSVQEKAQPPILQQLSPVLSAPLESLQATSSVQQSEPVASITASHDHWGTVYTSKYIRQPSASFKSRSSSNIRFFAKPEATPAVYQPEVEIGSQPLEADNREGGEYYQKHNLNPFKEVDAEKADQPLEASGLLKTVRDALLDANKLKPERITYPYALRMIFIRMFQALALHSKIEKIHFTFDDCTGFTLTNILTHSYFKVTPQMLHQSLLSVKKVLLRPLEKYLKSGKKPLHNPFLLNSLELYKILSPSLSHPLRTRQELLEDIKIAFINIETFTALNLQPDSHYAISANFLDAVECFNGLQKRANLDSFSIKEDLPEAVYEFLIECRQLVRNPERHFFDSKKQNITIPEVVTFISPKELKETVMPIPALTKILLKVEANRIESRLTLS